MMVRILSEDDLALSMAEAFSVNLHIMKVGMILHPRSSTSDAKLPRFLKSLLLRIGHLLKEAVRRCTYTDEN